MIVFVVHPFCRVGTYLLTTLKTNIRCPGVCKVQIATKQMDFNGIYPQMNHNSPNKLINLTWIAVFSTKQRLSNQATTECDRHGHFIVVLLRTSNLHPASLFQVFCSPVAYIWDKTGSDKMSIMTVSRFLVLAFPRCM